MKLVKPSDCNNRKTVEVFKTEEKGSDVNLATHLLVDCFENSFDVAIVISNDSDLMLPIKTVKKKMKKLVFVLNPHKNDSIQLKKFSHVHRQIKVENLAASQFPNPITTQGGDNITKPISW